MHVQQGADLSKGRRRDVELDVRGLTDGEVARYCGVGLMLVTSAAA